MTRRSTKASRTVYYVAHPGMQEYKAFHYEGTSIPFPTLLIKRRIPGPVAPRIARRCAESDDLELDLGGDIELGFD